jgi:hypothetical protein
MLFCIQIDFFFLLKFFHSIRGNDGEIGEFPIIIFDTRYNNLLVYAVI